ncbi:MAG: WD40/YVTN/BNR-like repeat-containing protein [Myxococcota bacterium]
MTMRWSGVSSVAVVALLGCTQPQLSGSTVVGNPGKMTAGATAEGQMRRLEVPVAGSTVRTCAGEVGGRLVDAEGEPLIGTLDVVAGVAFSIELDASTYGSICEIELELDGPVGIELGGPFGTTARGELSVGRIRLDEGGELLAGPVVLEVGYPGWIGAAGVGLNEASDITLSPTVHDALALRLADGSAVHPDPDQDGLIARADRGLGAPRGSAHPLSLGVKAGVTVVGLDGLQGTLDLDGATYETIVEPSGTGPDLEAVATGPLGAVAVGSTPDNEAAIRSSADLTGWADQAVEGYRIGGAAQGGGLYVTVGFANQIFSSIDGRTFERALISPEDLELYAVTYAEGRFIAGGQRDTDGVVITSADGQNWGVPAVIPDAKVLDLASGNGITVAIGLGGFLASSADTQAWTSHDDAQGRQLDAVVWDGDRFLISTDGDLLESTDGQTWTAVPTSVPMRTLAWTGETYIGASRDGGLYRSADAEDWVEVLADGPRVWRAIGVSPRLGETSD